MSRIYRSWRVSRPLRDGARRSRAPWLTLALAAALLIALGQPAEAYVGPGAGLGAIGAFLGLVATVLLTLGVLIIWPVRRLLRRARGKSAAKAPGADDAAANSETPNAGR